MSITHRHMLNVLSAAVERRREREVSVLDAGCGDCRLIAFLAPGLRERFPEHTFRFAGLDISDGGVQGADYIKRAHATLSAAFPGTQPDSVLTVITTGQPWPYRAGEFDFVISNQVLEHVGDHPAFFHEIARVLSPDGEAIHLCPLKECLWEGHAHMPLVHRMPAAIMAPVMAAFVRVGFRSRFRHYATKDPAITVASFAAMYAPILADNTNYLSQRQMRRIASSAGLTVSFDHSLAFYALKVSEIAGRPMRRYPAWMTGAADVIAVRALKRIASVCLVMRPTA